MDCEVDVKEISATARDLYECLSLCFDYPGFWLISPRTCRVISFTFQLTASLPQLRFLESEVSRFGCLLASLREGSTTPLVEVQIEYTRLFVGPGRPEIYPYEGSFLSKGSSGNLSRELLRLYAEEGVGVAPYFKEPPDHVSTELAFSGHLCRKQVEALERGQSHSSSRYARKQRDFLRSHLIPWIPDFAQTVERATVLDFYQSLARITREFLFWDQQRGQLP